MKRRLWLKLIGGFTLIIILGGIIMYVAVQRSTRSRYRELVKENDLAAAEYLAPFFAEYYAAEGGWSGVEALFAGPGDQDGPAGRRRMGPDSSMHPGMGRHRGMDPGMMMAGRGFGPPRIILTDEEGEIEADSAAGIPGRAPVRMEDLRGGMPVRITDGSAGSVVGYLYVGSMIGPVLEPADRAFLRSVNRSVFLTTVLVVMLAVGLGTFLVINITSPVWSLHAAAKRIGQGDLSARAGKDGSSRMKSGATAAGKRNSSRGSQRRDELGELTEQFNSMADSLEKAAESRKRIIADTAHELRTPVSLIQGKLEMILEGIYSPDRDTLSALYEETKLLAGLIEELQQLADADAGSLFLKKRPVSLSSLMEHAAEMFAPEMKEKGIIFSFPSPKSGEPFEEFPVRADPRKITQVIANLLSNSVRHTPEGGSVEAALDQSSGEVRFSITNSGPPIPENKLESVFDRFYRLDEGRSRKEGGTGLGLAICKVIVEAHGGRIWAENIRSSGVRFTFSLPRSL